MAKIVSEQVAYENLANAVIEQAADDYRKYLTSRMTDKAQSVERFFRSERYKTYTSVDGEYLIRKIRNEVKDKNIKILIRDYKRAAKNSEKSEKDALTLEYLVDYIKSQYFTDVTGLDYDKFMKLVNESKK